MNIKQGLFVTFGSLLGFATAMAGEMGPIFFYDDVHPVVALQGGYASITAGGNTQSFIGKDSDRFTYTSSGSGQNTGFIGVFLGAEHDLPWISRPGYFMQTGIEYNYFGRIGVDGINTVGVEPETSTLYTYSYNFHTQQVLATLKLFATTYERFHLYGEAGLGAAFNRSSQYYAKTMATGSLNLTPSFSNQSQTKLSYIVGFGVDTQISMNTRVGLGYRFSNFGSSSLDNGQITFNNYQYPVPFAVGSANVYANQLIARISYVF